MAKNYLSSMQTKLSKIDWLGQNIDEDQTSLANKNTQPKKEEIIKNQAKQLVKAVNEEKARLKKPKEKITYKMPKKEEIIKNQAKQLVKAVNEEKTRLKKPKEKIAYKMPKKTKEILDSINLKEKSVDSKKFSFEELNETYSWVQACSRILIKENIIPFESQNILLIPIYNGIMTKWDNGALESKKF